MQETIKFWQIAESDELMAMHGLVVNASLNQDSVATIRVGKICIYSPLETVSKTHIVENIRLKNYSKLKTLVI